MISCRSAGPILHAQPEPCERLVSRMVVLDATAGVELSSPRMAGSSAPDERLRQAIEALLEPERFREAERRLARALPELQNVLARALAEGGWLEPSRMEAIDRVAAT